MKSNQATKGGELKSELNVPIPLLWTSINKRAYIYIYSHKCTHTHSKQKKNDKSHFSVTQYVWHAIRFDFSIYIFWHTLNLSRSLSAFLKKAFTDILYIIIHEKIIFLSPEHDDFYRVNIWMHLQQKHTFFPFFFRWPLSVESLDMRPFKWMRMSVCVCEREWERVAQWHRKTSTRVHTHMLTPGRV